MLVAVAPSESALLAALGHSSWEEAARENERVVAEGVKQAAAALTANDILGFVTSRTLASDLSDDDIALAAKVQGLEESHGALFAIPFTKLTEAQWKRASELVDLGVL